jgi:putative transposase
MEAEVTQKIGAEPHERNEERAGYRNGHRDQRWDTRLGTLSLKSLRCGRGNTFRASLNTGSGANRR